MTLTSEGSNASTRARPYADPATVLPDVNPANIPRHIAIIMDGNGRWAQQRGFPREFGHRAGAAAVRETITACVRLGVEVLTLYSFSSENWKRPEREIAALMQLCVTYLQGECAELMRSGVRVVVIGRREGLPPDVRSAIEQVESTTAANRAMTLCLAVNYGSRTEITDAAQSLARDAAAGRIDPESITEDVFASRLNTCGLPDPDLLIRTAGELRVSNYLLWQISYSEIFVTDTCWPDFTATHLHEAIRDYARRSRRFGAATTEPAADA